MTDRNQQQQEQVVLTEEEWSSQSTSSEMPASSSTGGEENWGESPLESDVTDQNGAEARGSDEERLFQLVPLSTPSGQCKGRLYNEIMWKLDNLHDNGRWMEFDAFSNGMLDRLQVGQKDLPCVIVIEQGVAAHYKDDLMAAERLFNEALQLARKSENPLMLEGRALYWLAHTHRHAKKMGKALACLENAEQLLSTHSSLEDKAELCYAYGNFLFAYLAMMAKPSKQTVNRAKNYFQRELELASACPDERVRRKKMRYSLLKLAELNLDCRNERGRYRSVSMKDVLEAKACLDKVENELWEFMPIGTNIEFNFARSDQFYRQGNYERALFYAKLAASMIQDNGFDKDVVKANLRISHLNRLVHKDFIQEIPSGNFVEKILGMTDESSYSGDVESQSSDNE